MRPTSRSVLLLSALLVACSEATAPRNGAIASRTPEPALCCGGVATWTPSALSLPAGTWVESAARAINDSNIVVGSVSDATGFHRPVRWNAAGVPSIPAVVFANYSTFATGINLRGDMVGVTFLKSGNISGTWQPIRWLVGAPPLMLATLGSWGRIDGINGARVAVGSSGATSGQTHAVTWNAAGAITDIHPAGAIESEARGINDAGDIVGAAYLPDGKYHAWKWRANGTQQDLGIANPLGALGVNAAGEVAGTAKFLGGDVAVTWSAAGALTYLVGPSSPSEAFGISDLQRLVGRHVSGGWQKPWTMRGTNFVALPTLATWVGAEAFSVNRCGHAVGTLTTGTATNWTKHAARWWRSSCDA